MTVEIYTDGAALGNPGPGGHGVILKYGKHRKELSAGYRLTTNNRMELTAVIVGLEALKGENLTVTVFSDSRYVTDAVEKKWLEGWMQKNFKGKKNEDLWRRFLETYRRHRVRFVWLKGHNGHPENERCDQMAVAAAKGTNLLSDAGYEMIDLHSL